MIKQLRLYRFTNAAPTFEDWVSIFDHYFARECQNGEEKYLGWRIVPTTNDDRGMELQGSRYIYSEAHYFRRSVPKSTLERELNKRVKAIVDRGETVNSKERSSLKAELRRELLQKMPQTDTVIPFIVDTERHEIWIGATSEGIAGDINRKLLGAKCSVIAIPMFEGIDVGDWLTGWANLSRELPDGIELGGKIKMTARDAADVSISTSKEYLESDEIRSLIETRTVQSLELVNEALSATVNHDGSIKSIKFNNKDERYDDFAHEISYYLIELRSLIDALCKIVGAPFGK